MEYLVTRTSIPLSIAQKSYYMRISIRLGAAGGGDTQVQRLLRGALFLSKAMMALEQNRCDSIADTMPYTVLPSTGLERGHRISEERVV